MKTVDRKTGREVLVGQTLIRKNYKGFKTRYEIVQIDHGLIQVRKLDSGDRWVYLNVKPEALQLDQVML